MLYRVGKLGYLALFLFLVYGWTHWHPRSGEALHHSWEVTREKFAQGASFADDIFDPAHYGKQPSSVEAEEPLLDIAVPATAEDSTATQEPTTTESSATTTSSAPAKDLIVTSTPAVIPLQADSPYAYVFYATLDTYACSVLVNIQRLQDVLHTRHRIFVLVSHAISASYLEAFESRNVTVSIQTPPKLAEGSVSYYEDCLLKLFAFKMHQIDPSLKKVISLDSDQLVMRNLDHLFESKVDVDLAAPRAYWIARDAISSTFMLINLSDRLWNTVDHAIKTVKTDKYDMDLVQDLLGDTVMMLPGSYVTPNSHWEDWNIPKWFHGSNSTSATATEAEVPEAASTSLTSPLANDLDKRHIDKTTKRDIKARDTPIAKEQSAQPLRSIEEEQTSASSGDIFSYLDSAEEVKAEDDSETPPPPRPTEAEEGIGQTAPVADTDETAEDEYLPPHSDVDSPDSSAYAEVQVEPKFQHMSLAEMEKRPLFNELYELVPAVEVLHFFGLGKPWTYSLAEVKMQRPGSHPLFVEQFRIWRQTALDICPLGILDAL